MGETGATVPFKRAKKKPKKKKKKKTKYKKTSQDKMDL